LPGIYEEIENIKRRMIEEKEKLIESAKESMMSKLTLKN
jgi:molecular chaperone GrpE (heat shock protein)